MAIAPPTGNPYIDALAGTPWPNIPDNTLVVYFDDPQSYARWTEDEELAFWKALDAWSSVANISFVEIEPLNEGTSHETVIDLAFVNLDERKVTIVDGDDATSRSSFSGCAR